MGESGEMTLKRGRKRHGEGWETPRGGVPNAGKPQRILHVTFTLSIYHSRAEYVLGCVLVCVYYMPGLHPCGTSIVTLCPISTGLNQPEHFSLCAFMDVLHYLAVLIIHICRILERKLFVQPFLMQRSYLL